MSDRPKYTNMMLRITKIDDDDDDDDVGDDDDTCVSTTDIVLRFLTIP